MPALLPVIMAGGSGSRLWPLSRQQHPKQFIRFNGEQSLLQQTVLRAQALSTQAPLVVTNEHHRFLAAEQLQAVCGDDFHLLLEPEAKNTAATIALAANWAKQALGEDTQLLVLAADHVMAGGESLLTAVESASKAAMDGCLVAFGIVPTHAETGYGYIQRANFEGQASFADQASFEGKASLEDHTHQTVNPQQAAPILAFHEKPSLAVAEQYLSSGDYWWNSGMFLFSAHDFLVELNTYQPEIANCCELAANFSVDRDFIRIDHEPFRSCPSLSVDYAVMEHTQRGAVVPFTGNWSDIGSFASLWEFLPKEAAGNVHWGDVTSINSHNNLVVAEHKLVATLGVDDLVVVDTKDAMLVAHRSQSQQLREVVAQLAKADRPELQLHRQVSRPWGSYDSIDEGNGFKVKRIKVKPGQRLSLQYHHHRAEHWVVVRGTATVTKGNQQLTVNANESLYIPAGETHSLANNTPHALEIIEVQTGDYLAEDDIIRLDDDYGRANSSD
ncbi:mannose-1-phosphate guanylyltransferase/mannose-6-phosphate isomerase [Umboniibacter marinipuniceus]|uniref:mannose-1-phosphate guanylyltransferase n=1 Tax=Umboniibacter marinipuniceus TaxID=569599 RepID=A0A3M0A4H7_9GAMM|nr:mannose-1-phosphate guanylyltransferase/mannose-6-phosphate isomerase [Umboniibacter marinipuniceus]RMA79526.1 mannose-1-phosphate guanylyltransferase [Umboniibacter marinipuniceus]